MRSLNSIPPKRKGSSIERNSSAEEELKLCAGNSATAKTTSPNLLCFYHTVEFKNKCKVRATVFCIADLPQSAKQRKEAVDKDSFSIVPAQPWIFNKSVTDQPPVYAAPADL